MGINASVFSGPTDLLAMGHPFCSVAYNETDGIPFGIDVRSGAIVYFDPWLLKNAGLINSAFGMLLGPKGHGKSATMKILALRLMLIAAGNQTMRAAINDYKPEGSESEYGEVSRVTGSKVFKIANMNVNPFEADLYMTATNSTYELGILGTSEAICEFAKGSDLRGHENTAHRIAIHTMLQFDQNLWSPTLLFKILRSISDTQIQSYFRNLDDKLQRQMTTRLKSIVDISQQRTVEGQIEQLVHAKDNHKYEDIKAAADSVSTMLGDVLTGSYASMFGNEHSLYSMLTQRAVTKDWRGVEPEAETLMRILDTRIKIAAIENNRIDLLPHIEIDDEKHKSMDNLVYAKSHSFFSEIARGTHTCNLSATHRFDSVRRGGVGSELYRLGETIINNLGFVMIGRQNDDPKILDELQTRYNLSNANTRILTELPNYTFGLKIGESEKMRFVRVFATPNELAVMKTNASTDRMIARPDVFSSEQIEKFAKENGIVYIGNDVKE